MANKPQDEKSVEGEPQGVSRRELFVGAGVGVAGLVVGGAVAGVIPRRTAPSPPVPDTWIGRNIADCTGCRLCRGGVLADQGAEDPAGDFADQRAAVLPGRGIPGGLLPVRGRSQVRRGVPGAGAGGGHEQEAEHDQHRHDAVSAHGAEQRLHAVPGQVSGAGGELPSHDERAADLRPVRRGPGVREGVPVDARSRSRA